MATHSEYGVQTEAETVAKAFSSGVEGKVILITGVNPSGLGGATAKALAMQHPKLLILTARTAERIEATVKEIKAIDPNVETRFVQIDLSSNASVRKAAAEINAYAEKNIDIVINNAGTMGTPVRQLSADGIELQFASNHIGHFLLINLIIPKILSAASSNSTGAVRIVNLTSWGHNYSPVRFSDVNFEKSGADLPETERPNIPMMEAADAMGIESKDPAAAGYLPMAAYGASKSANVLFSVGLNKRLAKKGVRSLAVHPGGIMTELMRHMDTRNLEEIAERMQIEWKSLSTGSSTTVVAALDPKLTADGKNVYLADCQLTEPAAWAVDEDAAERLWKLSEKLVGESFAL